MAEKSRDKYIRLPTFPRPGGVRSGYISRSSVGRLHGRSLFLLLGDVRGSFPTPEKDFFNKTYLDFWKKVKYKHLYSTDKGGYT